MQSPGHWTCGFDYWSGPDMFLHPYSNVTKQYNLVLVSGHYVVCSGMLTCCGREDNYEHVYSANKHQNQAI